MTITAFPKGASSWGVPMTGGIPAGGKHYWVDPANGNNGNSGLDPMRPMDTVEAALARCTAGKNDTIHLRANGQASGSSRDTATIAWSKDATHLVGECAPTHVSQRARIAPSTAFTPLITISGDGCQFENVQFFQGFAGASVCTNVTGERNAFKNCHFAGIGHATAAAEATSSSLLLVGDGENTFYGCTIGLDTITRSAACAELELTTAAVRNSFTKCKFITMTDDATSLFIKADASGDLDRYTILDDCLFINAVASTSTTMTAATDVHATAGGMLIFNNCTLIGATDWEAADSTNIWLAGHGQQASGDLLTGIAHTLDVA